MVYVDDIVFIGNNSNFISKFVEMIVAKFSVKDLSYLNHFIGVENIPTRSGLFLSQHNQIRDILTHFNMDGDK